MNNFYVYQYSDPITNLPVYIGKGVNSRLFHHWKNRHTHYNKEFGLYLLKLEEHNLQPRIEKIYQKLSNYDAYLIEFKKIKEFGRLGIDQNGTLYNRSIGFEYFNIDPYSAPDSELICYLNSVHFNYIEIPEDERLEIIKRYENNSSIQDLCRIFNRGPHKIIEVLKQSNVSIRSRGGQFGERNGMFGKKRENTAYFLGKKHKSETIERLSNSGKKLTILDGVEYSSRRDAMASLGISYSTLLRRLKNNI